MRAVQELLHLLHRLGATMAVFSHSREELERVVRTAAEHLDSAIGRGEIIMEARRNSTTKSDLLLLAGQIDDKLFEARIEVKNTPPYIVEFQIDEATFEKVLDDEVSYFNQRAKAYDINSVRSIYVLRADTSPSTIEKCKAVFVTSNSGFARAAYGYGEHHKEAREVSSVITDFSLANMAWLKAPMGAPSLPRTEVLAFSYAALQPTKELWRRFLEEVDKLEKQGRITARDHQLLRSSTLAYDELMNMTLGDEEALTEETIVETLRRVTEEIKKEEVEKLTYEKEEHRRTQDERAALYTEKKGIQERMYWRCHRSAKTCSWMVSASIGLLLLLGFGTGLGLRSNNQVLGWIFVTSSGALFLMSLLNLLIGNTVKDFHRRIRDRCLRWCIKREARRIGIDLNELGNG